MAAFEAAKAELDSEGIQVVSASVDPLDKAESTARDLALSYPVGHSLPMEATAEILGAFYEVRRAILQATGMVIRPDTTIAVACYSTGPIGRLDVDDVLRVVRFYKAHT